MLVGLRGANLPNEIEAIFLHQFMRDEFGGHTVAEIKLAFTKAIKYELPALDDPKCYENFSPEYISRVMKAYRLWATEFADKILQEKNRYKLLADYETKRLQLQPIEWREVIESDYQNFLKGVCNWDTWPEEHYNTLAADGYFKTDIWINKLKSAKAEIVHDLNKQLVIQQNLLSMEESARYRKTQDLLSKIEEYKSGSRDKELELIAKQRVVLIFFSHNQKLENQNIYLQKQND